MRILLSVLPVSILMVYSQLIVKWRMNTNWIEFSVKDNSWHNRLILYITDPYILSSYGASLLASFAWLFVISRLPLAVAFPIYQGLIVMLVILGSYSILGEDITGIKLLAICLILAGVILGVQ